MLKLFRLALVIALLSPAAHSAERDVPRDLEDWQGWVLEGEAYRRCPFFFDSAAEQQADFVCAWPGQLDLSVAGTGGRFSQQWTVYVEEQWVPLPGDAAYWPNNVTVGGRSAEVIARQGVPSVRLGLGGYRPCVKSIDGPGVGVFVAPAKAGAQMRIPG